MTLDDVELGRLEGQVRVLEERLAAADAAEDHHRVELEAARSDASDARVALKEAQVRVEDWRRRVDDMQRRLADAEEARRRAEEERSAVIAVLGRKARKQLSPTAEYR
jgi:predicted  nucleic acid-binding Zn-ribbon protein